MDWKNNKKGVSGVVIMVLVVVIAALGFTGVSAADDGEFQSLLTLEEIDELLLGYFDGLNVTEIYNTYNEVTNEFITNEFYNQTFINQTFNNYTSIYLNETYNEFVTNNYYEEN